MGSSITFLLPILSLISWIACYGLMRRTVWMWYLAWLYLGLVSDIFWLPLFYTAVTFTTSANVLFGAAITLGGQSLCLCAGIWWTNRRPQFTTKY